MAKENYTLGEVAKLGLLLTMQGTRIYDRSHITKIAAKMQTGRLKTKNGWAKTLTVEQIKAYNMARCPLLVDPTLKRPEDN